MAETSYQILVYGIFLIKKIIAYCSLQSKMSFWNNLFFFKESHKNTQISIIHPNFLLIFTQLFALLQKRSFHPKIKISNPIHTFTQVTKITKFDYMHQWFLVSLNWIHANQLGLEWHKGEKTIRIIQKWTSQLFYIEKMAHQSEASAPYQHLCTFLSSSKEPEQSDLDATANAGQELSLLLFPSDFHLWLWWDNQKGHAGSDSWTSLHHSASVLDLL